MKLRNIIFTAAAMVLALAPVAKADDVFTQADALYFARTSDVSTIHAAKSAYQALLSGGTLSNDQKIRAVTQLGHLAIFEGEMVGNDINMDKAARMAIFQDCFDGFAKTIDPAVIHQENPAYYYFRGVCLAYWGKYASTLQALGKVSDLLRMVQAGERPENSDFEGGGVWRLAAGFHSNPKARELHVPGLYDPAGALVEINKAMASPGTADPTTGVVISGQRFYENWETKALVYVELGDNKNAAATYTAGINQINVDLDAGSAPVGREPESAWELKTDEKELAALPH